MSLWLFIPARLRDEYICARAFLRTVRKILALAARKLRECCQNYGAFRREWCAEQREKRQRKARVMHAEF
jgi:hypothetical protein